ncbi:MAG: peptide chain release factor N(5)-glutamine methyltransferase, partial [Treponema sp.]|nr:peptide chain release factor N(5)-glutamine methyltransferase [Treponema sp.]
VRVLDLCTGCGAIAIALKNEMPELEVWAADISAEAIEVAKSNAARLLPPESIHFFYGDLYNTLTNPNPQISNPHYLFTVVVSNPPYIPTGEIASLPAEVRCEPVTALDGGSDGLEVIRRIISRTDEFLCHGGVLLLEADPRQMESIGALLKEKGFQNIQTQKDLSGKERIIICQNV